MTNEELVSLIQRGENVQANMAQLYKQNRNFIWKVALPFSKSAEMDDLMQEGYLGLVKSIEKYDPGLGFKFLTYAEHYIKKAMRWYIQNSGMVKKLPPDILSQISKYQKFRSDYQATNGLEPVDEEYCVFLNISPNNLKKLRKFMVESQIISIDSPLSGTEDYTLGDTISDDFCLEESILDQVATERCKHELWDAVKNLKGRQAEIVERIYRNGESPEAIGTRLKVSQQRVYQLRDEGIKALRGNRKVKEIAEIFGYDSYLAYHWGVGRFKTTGTSSVEFLVEKQMDLAMSASSRTPLTAERMKEKYGYISPHIQHTLEKTIELERNILEKQLQFERMLKEYRQKRRVEG